MAHDRYVAICSLSFGDMVFIIWITVFEPKATTVLLLQLGLHQRFFGAWFVDTTIVSATDLFGYGLASVYLVKFFYLFAEGKVLRPPF